MSYQEGFEDATELCLHELNKTGNVEIAKKKIHEFLVKMKTRKYDRLESMLKLK